MSTRYNVPRSRIDALLDALAGLQGFVCLDVDRGSAQRVSALPAQQWSLPDDPERFQATVAAIVAAHQHLLPGTAIGGIAGSLFYDIGRQTVPGFRSRHAPLPSLGWLGLYLWQLDLPTVGDGTLQFHHRCPADIRARILELARGNSNKAEAPAADFRITERFRAISTPADYGSGVERILAYIRAGDCYQVNLSQAFEGRFEGSPWRAWQSLIRTIPVPHGGYLDVGPWQLLSVSPELFLEIRNRHVVSKPIKGTRPRGDTAEQDRALAVELSRHPKDRAENLMIVDLIRNDLSHFCQPFSVQVPQLFEVESFNNVHQLVSTVTGTLKPEISPFEAMLSAFPGGSITGAPKRRAMEIIDQLEPHIREPYCGSLFWWGADDGLDSNIAIRSLHTLADGRIRAWAGCGIVADSDPKDEYEESLTKIRRLLDTLETAGRE